MLDAGCKIRRQSSEAKDVAFIDGNLAKRFTFSETCQPRWQAATDVQCRILQYDANQNPLKSLSSATVYQKLQLDGPSGEIGAREVASKQTLVDQIASPNAKAEAQNVLDALKAKIEMKDKLKAELAGGGRQASCFPGSNVGESGIHCDSLEAVFAGALGNGATGDQVTCKFSCNCQVTKYCGERLLTRRSCDHDLYASDINLTKTFATVEEGKRALQSVCSGLIMESTPRFNGLNSPCSKTEAYYDSVFRLPEGATVSCGSIRN